MGAVMDDGFPNFQKAKRKVANGKEDFPSASHRLPVHQMKQNIIASVPL